MQATKDDFEAAFPFEYQGGGYFRRKGVPQGTTAEILHGEQAVKFVHQKHQSFMQQVLAVLNDDAYAASFQTLDQYRKALVVAIQSISKCQPKT
jgi:hypothetical protein